MAATLSELQQQNPNIRSQIEVWQRERANNGQSPADWEAFRQHAMAIGAPDPGPEAPQEFAQSASAASDAHRAASASASSPSQQIQQPPQQIQQPPQQVQQPQAQQPTFQQPPMPQPSFPQAPQVQQPRDPAVLDALRIKADYEADKNTPTDKWLKARGMTKAQLDAALKLAESAEGR